MPLSKDELCEFLSAFLWIYPNLNDTFGYACADSERIVLGDADESNVVVLVNVWIRYRHAGIRAYAAKIRGQEVLTELQTPEYLAAKIYLENWEYESD